MKRGKLANNGQRKKAANPASRPGPVARRAVHPEIQPITCGTLTMLDPAATDQALERHVIIKVAVKRAATVIGTVNTEKLDNQQRITAHAMTAQLGALALMASPTTIKRLEARQGESVADAAAVFELIAKPRTQLRLAN